MIVPLNSVLYTPGLAEAVAQERLVRDAAFLPVTETVGGFELRPMTLQHYLMLRLVRCPLLGARNPEAEPVTVVELATFLWVLSPEFTAHNGWRKRRFLGRCRREFGPPGPLFVWQGKRAKAKWERIRDQRAQRMAATLEVAWEYMEQTMQDRPGGGRVVSASYYSDVVFWWGTLGRNGYPMRLDQVLDMPLKVLFQCLREVLDSKGGKIGNPSDGKVSEFLRVMNANLPRPSTATPDKPPST